MPQQYLPKEFPLVSILLYLIPLFLIFAVRQLTTLSLKFIFSGENASVGFTLSAIGTQREI